MTAAVAQDKGVVEHVQDEIDAIKTDETPKYQPQAWTREGQVD